MKNFTSIILLILIAASFAAAQSFRGNEFQTLEAQISTESSLDKINETISQAKRIFEVKEKISSENPADSVENILDFAAFRKKAFLILDAGKYGKDLSNTTKVVWIEKFHENARELQKLLEKAIAICEKLNLKNPQTATAKYELGWFFDNYVLLPKRPPNWEDKLKTIRKAQAFYAEALVLQETLLGTANESTLVTTFVLANSYMKSGDFEKALPLYEKFTLTAEKKYGKKFELLVPALRIYAAMLSMIGLDEDAIKVEKHINETTGKRQEDLSSLYFELSPRAKSFKYRGLKEIGGKVSLNTVSVIARTPNNTGKTEIPIEKAVIFSNVTLIDAKFVDIILVKIIVDENGKVIDAEAEIENEESKKKIEQNVLKWEFEPLIYQGKARRIKGFVKYYKRQ